MVVVVVAVILSRVYRMRERHRGSKSGNCKRMLICSIFFCWGSQGFMPLRRKIRFRTIRQAVSAFELMPQKKRRRKKMSLDKSLLNGCFLFFQQQYTVDHSASSTTSDPPQVLSKTDTVHTSPISSSHGIGPTWRYSSNSYSNTWSIARMSSLQEMIVIVILRRHRSCDSLTGIGQ